MLTGLKRHAEALTCFASVLETERRIYGPRSKEVATTLTMLAHSQLCQEQLDLAAATINEALSIREAGGWADSPTFAIALRMSGSIASDQGHYEQALKDLEQTLALMRKLNPPDHPDIATTYFRIAGVLSSSEGEGRQPT